MWGRGGKGGVVLVVYFVFATIYCSSNALVGLWMCCVGVGVRSCNVSRHRTRQSPAVITRALMSRQAL